MHGRAVGVSQREGACALPEGAEHRKGGGAGRRRRRRRALPEGAPRVRGWEGTGRQRGGGEAEPGDGRHDEHRAVARELALRLLAERDGGAHLRLLHHHRLQRPERPGAAARLADHAVSAAGRGCRGWAGLGWGVRAGPDLSPQAPPPRGTRGPVALGPPALRGQLPSGLGRRSPSFLFSTSLTHAGQ